MKGLLKTLRKSKHCRGDLGSIGSHRPTNEYDTYAWSGHLGHSSTKSKPEDWTGYACLEMLVGGKEFPIKGEYEQSAEVFRAEIHSFCKIIKDTIGLEDVCVDIELSKEWGYAGTYWESRGSICFANITMKKYRELCNKFDYDYETQVCSEKGDWW